MGYHYCDNTLRATCYKGKNSRMNRVAGMQWYSNQDSWEDMQWCLDWDWTVNMLIAVEECVVGDV
jgi:hypothetical protein